MGKYPLLVTKLIVANKIDNSAYCLNKNYNSLENYLFCYPLLCHNEKLCFKHTK